jgi:hypothetical protein
MAETSYVSSWSHLCFSASTSAGQTFTALCVELNTMMNIISQPEMYQWPFCPPQLSLGAYMPLVTVIYDSNEENRGLSTTGSASFICYMWEINTYSVQPFYVWSVHFNTHSHFCLLTLWIWEVFLREFPCSCGSQNSYRRETDVVIFHLQMKFWGMKEMWVCGRSGWSL